MGALWSKAPVGPSLPAIPAEVPGTRVGPSLTLQTSRLCQLNIIERPQLTLHRTEELPSWALPEFLTVESMKYNKIIFVCAAKFGLVM